VLVVLRESGEAHVHPRVHLTAQVSHHGVFSMMVAEVLPCPTGACARRGRSQSRTDEEGQGKYGDKRH
jgi:hypothetical protein